jgi:hypothetical protein
MDVMDLHEVGYVVTAFFDCNGLALGMVVRVMPSDFESTGCEGGCDQPTMRRERSMLHLPWSWQPKCEVCRMGG